MPSIPAHALSEVAIVGQGRLGATVTRQLRSAGVVVHAIDRGQSAPPGLVTWLTVPDASIYAAARACRSASVLLHASGASELAVLDGHPCAGSLHPLMTFPGDVAPPPPVPAAVTGAPQAIETARALAAHLGWTPFEVKGDRRAYHAAAVVAGNFATTLLAEAAEILTLAGVPADLAPGLLAPLALQSLRNAASLGPAAALTGPVVRGDHDVISGHLSVLSNASPGVQRTYRALLEATERLANRNSDISLQRGD